jgi:hypothetical protein
MSSIETLLAEQPLVVSLMLGTLAVGLIYGWLQTGKKAAAVAGLIAVLLIPAAWVIASKWVTDREQIETLIYEIADAVERNDHVEAVRVISDPKTKAQARQELNQWTFSLAAVNRIRSINIIDGSYPLEADVDMSVKVRVSHVKGSIRDQPVPRRLILTLEKSEDGWLVTQYRHLPIAGGPDRYSTVPRP